MTLLQKLTGHLHRVFDKDPQPVLAFRIGVTSGTLTWSVADQILDLTAQGGTASSLQIDLDQYTIAALRQFIIEQDGYTTELPVTNLRRITSAGDVRTTSTGDRRIIRSLGLDPAISGLPATLLVEGSGNIAESRGNRLMVMRSPLLIYMQTIGRELKGAKAQIAEMLRQMVMTQSEGEWTDLWGTYYGVPRRTGEADAAYAARIIVEVLRPRVNHVAMEVILEEALAAAVTIREPWKEIFILSGSSTLSGSHKLYDGSFYAYNTLEIQSQADRDDMAVLGERNKAAGTWLWYDQITELPSPVYEDDGPPISRIIGELNYLLQSPWQSILSVEPSVSGDQLLFAEYRDFIAWNINATGAGYQEADLYNGLGIYYNGFSQLSELGFPLYRLEAPGGGASNITLWAGSNWQPNVLDTAGYLAGNGSASVTEIPWATVTTFDIEITTTAWLISDLFQSGEQGAWYDPSDLSTMFQDAAKTTPVTAANQPVRVIEDKSGNGNNATAPSDAARPMLRESAGGLWYLEFDGVDDILEATGYNKLDGPNLSVGMAWRSTLASPSLSGSNSRLLGLGSEVEDDTRSVYGFRFWMNNFGVRSVNAVTKVGPETQFFIDNPGVASSRRTDSTDTLEGWVNGANKLSVTPAPISLDAEPTKNRYPLTIARLSYSPAQFASIEVYGVVVVERAIPDNERESLENYLADKAGVTL